MFHWFHKWEIIAARNRFQPVYRDPQNPIMGLEERVGVPKTDVLYKCKCGKLKSVAIPGKWELQDLRA